MTEPAKLLEPRYGRFLHRVRCGLSPFYVRPERGMEHHFACRRCGQKHAAWETWEPYERQER